MKVKELWAIIDKKTWEICLSRWWSSSKQKILVFWNLESLQKALHSPWTKQVFSESEVVIEKIFG